MSDENYLRAQLASFTGPPGRGATDSSTPGAGGAQATPDPVRRPSHYTAGEIECIDAIDSAISHLSGRDAFDTGQVIKYVWRWRLKGGRTDLEKARWYLDRLIGRLTK